MNTRLLSSIDSRVLLLMALMWMSNTEVGAVVHPPAEQPKGLHLQTADRVSLLLMQYGMRNSCKVEYTGPLAFKTENWVQPSSRGLANSGIWNLSVCDDKGITKYHVSVKVVVPTQRDTPHDDWSVSFTCDVALELFVMSAGDNQYQRVDINDVKCANGKPFVDVFEKFGEFVMNAEALRDKKPGT